MKLLTLITILIFIFNSPLTFASLNLDITIGKMVGNKLVEVNKTITADYDKDVVIISSELKDKIILNFKKFSNVLVNGKKISPIQVDMKLVNKMQKAIGRTQTVTSFYNRTAKFSINSTGSLTSVKDLDISLKFEEIN